MLAAVSGEPILNNPVALPLTEWTDSEPVDFR